jgi:hypothetical protein
MEAVIRIKEHMKQVKQLEASLGILPTLRDLIPPQFRLENVDPLLLWIHEQAEGGKEKPTAGVARMPEATNATEGFGLRKGIPDMINIPNPPKDATTTEIGNLEETKPAATKPHRQPELGIGKVLPQCQNIDDIAGNIRNSEFG